MQDEDWWLRRAAAEQLGEMGAVGAVAPLIAALENDDYRKVRYEAAEALGKIGDERAVVPLVRGMESGWKQLPLYAIRALARHDTQQATAKLIHVQWNEDMSVRRAAARGLANRGWKPTTNSQRVRFLLAIAGIDDAAKVASSAVASENDPSLVEGPFELDTPILARISVGTDESPELIVTQWVEFEQREDGLKASLWMYHSSWPKSDWRIRIELLGADGTILAYAETVHSVSGMIRGYAVRGVGFLDFSCGQLANLAEINRFRLTIRQIAFTP